MYAILVKVVSEMANKIINIEKDIHLLKSPKSNNCSTIDPVIVNEVSEKKIEHQKDSSERQTHQEQDANKSNEYTSKPSKDPCGEIVEDIKMIQKTPFKCDICGQKCKKEITLKNNINKQHEREEKKL